MICGTTWIACRLLENHLISSLFHRATTLINQFLKLNNVVVPASVSFPRAPFSFLLSRFFPPFCPAFSTLIRRDLVKTNWIQLRSLSSRACCVGLCVFDRELKKKKRAFEYLNRQVIVEPSRGFNE